MRTLEEVNEIIQNQPKEFRRWCYSWACACLGCIRHVVTEEEWEMWKSAQPDADKPREET